MRTARLDGVRVLLVVCAVTAWPDLAIARQPETGLPANLHVDRVPAGGRGHAPAFAGVSPPDCPNRRGADVPGPGPSRGSAPADRGCRCPHRLHVRWRHPGQCARLPSDDAAGTAVHRPRDGAHPRAARWHRSSGPGRKRRRLEEQRHDVRDPPGDRGRPSGGAGDRARRGSRGTTGQSGRCRNVPGDRAAGTRRRPAFGTNRTSQRQRPVRRAHLGGAPGRARSERPA